MNYWLAKSEPATYSWERFVKEGRAMWDGVRNYQARNNLRAMKKGDRVLFYHSVVGQEVVGVAEVSREAYPDPTAKDDPRWSVVDLIPLKPVRNPVSLAAVKADPLLKDIALVRQGRLSVLPLSKAEFDRILELGR
jgi:predicted RNA-binding protein with PUA-like domain